MRKSVLFILCMLCLQMFAQPVSKYLTKGQALEELDWYIQMIEKKHPHPYQYTNKDSIYAALNALKKEYRAKDSIISQGFIMDLSAINYFWDGHTNVFLNDYFYTKNSCFPLIYADEQLNIYLSGTNILIESINSCKVEEIVALLDKYNGADNFRANNYIQLSWSNMFNIILSEADILPPYTIRGKTPNGVDTIFVQNAWSKEKVEQQRDINKQYNVSCNKEQYELQIFPADSIALFTYDECFSPRKYANIDSIMYSFFSDCNDLNIKYLFIDISRNAGGDYMGYDIFLPFLIKKDLSYTLYRNTNDTTKKIARWKCDFASNSFIKSFKNNTLAPFKGNIFVYQSPWTASGAAILSSLLKAAANAKIVGSICETIIPYTAFCRSHQFPYSDATLRVSQFRIDAEKPQLPRNKNGNLLIDIEYPFDMNERMKLDDFKNIISKYHISQ